MTRRLHIPLEGKCWLLAGLCLVIIGWFKGLNLILLLGYLMLTAQALNGLLAGRGLNRLSARRRIDGPAFAGVPFGIDIELHNPGPGDAIGVSLEDHGPHHHVTHFQVRLAAGETVQVRRTVTVPRRCRYVLDPPRLSSGVPFGLVRRSLAMGGEDAVAVFPRLGRLHIDRFRQFLRQAAAGADKTRAVPRGLPALTAEFHGLRQYRAGDSTRWIHWRTSARRGELMVREFDPGWSEDLLVVLEPWLPRYLVEEDAQASDTAPASGAARQWLEDAISLTATLCWQWAQQQKGRLTLLVADDQAQITASGVMPMLERLANLPGTPDTRLDRLQDALTNRQARAGHILLISSQDASPLADELAGQCQHPVARLLGGQLSSLDFYEAPTYETRPSPP